MVEDTSNFVVICEAHKPEVTAPRTEGPIHTETRGLRWAHEILEPTHGLPPAREGTTRERQSVYDTMVEELKEKYKIAIRKWRKQMSGVAYELKYRDGRIKRLITAPRPRSPVSAAIFLHEVGHHAVGFKRYESRCMEEYYVWQWAFREMATREIAIGPRVMRHYKRSMFHYVRMATKKGEAEMPGELREFLHWPG